MRRVPPVALALLTLACPEPSEDGEGSDTETTDADTPDLPGDGDGDDTDGCPVGVEGCPCTDAGTCYPGLACEADVCVPTDPCPVGEAGCPCTHAGTCDPGSVCEDGVCTCTPGELGCACLEDDACSDALDCVAGLCEIPELVSEAANGWGPVTCWAARGQWPGGAAHCFAAYGEVAYVVRPACEIAQLLLTAEWMPWPTWPGGDWWYQCAAGEPFASVEAPWTDGGCFLSQGGVQCFGRIGHLWIEVRPDCAVAPVHEFDPWGPAFGEVCAIDPLPAPVGDQVDEWRCGSVQGLNNPLCAARLGNHWTQPAPLCYGLDPVLSQLVTVFQYEAHDGWPLFTCL